MLNSNKPLINLYIIITIFIIHITGYYLFIGNSPLDPIDDYAHIIWAIKTPWNELISHFLTWNPLSDIKYDNGVVQHALGSRVAFTVLLKLLYAFFRENHAWYHLFHVALSGLASCLIYIFSSKLCNHRCIPFLSALSFSFFPPAFIQNIWLSDTAEIARFCILLFVGFAYSTHYLFKLYKNKIDLRVIACSLCALAILYFALKTKPTAYIIPLVCITYGYYWIISKFFKPYRYFALVTFFIVAIYIIHVFIGYNPSTLIKLIFFNNQSVYGIPDAFALFSLDMDLTRSVASSFGFFMGWLTLGSIVFLCIKGNKPVKLEVKLLLIWIIWQILLFGSARNDIRYLAELMLPIFILLPLLFSRVFDLIKQPKIQKIFFTIVLTSFLITIIHYFDHDKFLKRWIIGSYSSVLYPAETIFRDYYNVSKNKAIGFRELLGFVRPYEMGGAAEPGLIDNLIVRCDIPSIIDRKYSDSQLKEYFNIHQEGYIIARSPLSKMQNQFILKELSFIDANISSPLDLIREHFGIKPKRDPIYIYKVSYLN